MSGFKVIEGKGGVWSPPRMQEAREKRLGLIGSCFVPFRSCAFPLHQFDQPAMLEGHTLSPL